ncbi:MAG: tRNA preQ1(34) S-adenosylmethionine ribosyltransferase-isomerase QueA [Chloroflexi bacterium]|nr:tRNA preQ1(34) S-adenosylmethionine ribosyltransferase-isomerase QueA [Chloroflexota bacterium]MDA1219718.1 tRNA preQ1(34) S-adenosylmethionine ribosyltransferase-isomerase QueA [Chloroflexota bacterium]
MQTSDFDYQLPPDLIAQTPLEPRDASRLMTLDRATGQIDHHHFSDILNYLRPGDLMVFNQSRVIPARLYGHCKDTNGKVELLLLRRESPGVWQTLGKPGRRLRAGTVLVMESPDCDVQLEVEVLDSDAEGIKRVWLSTEEGIDRLGEVPLPPYIHEKLDDPERYQTVYARQPGSVAAPTAGLHFTDALLAQIRALGVEQTFVTLHVGLDTFRPVQGEDIAEHHIHTEYFQVSGETAHALNRVKQEGRRIIAVGTTSVRVLEQLGQDTAQAGQTKLMPTAGQANIFILPGHEFRLVDAMITNFHLPRSTLLMLVSAFAGRENILAAYREAIDYRYRFFSFGDAMLIG